LPHLRKPAIPAGVTEPRERLGSEPPHDAVDDPAHVVEGEASMEIPLPVRTVAAARTGARRIIAVGGGKGGAGKSLLAANIGIYLAQLGKRVVLLDADLGGANLHTFVGVERPAVSLADLFEKRVAKVEDVVVGTSVPNLGLVSGEGDPSWIANPRPAQKFRLLTQVQRLNVDYLVVDLGPGSGINALDFFLVANVGLLVFVPEPTSVENTVRFIKSAFLRRLRRAGLERAVTLVTGTKYEGGIPSPLDLYLAAREKDPELAALLAREIHEFQPKFVVNQTRTRADLELGPALSSTIRRRLGLDVEYFGHVEADDAVWLAVRRRRPLLIEHPDAPASQCVDKIVRRLLSEESMPERAGASSPLPRPSEEHNHYELLEIDPSASEEEIRRAYRRLREVYSHESMVVCGFFSRERLDAFMQRAEEAYDTLMDATQRKIYDVATFPDGLPKRRTPTLTPSLPAPTRESPTGPVPTPAARVSTVPGIAAAAVRDERPVASTPGQAAARPVLPEPPVGPETEFTGALLRAIREARGIDLLDISQRTKVGINHLRAIEDERFEAMLSPVYLRGFLVEYARYLKLDAQRVAHTFLARYNAARIGVEE